ncbi:hypothetical protein [Streptomyces mirabilis]
MPRNHKPRSQSRSRDELRNTAVSAAISGIIRFLLDQLRELL